MHGPLSDQCVGHCHGCWKVRLIAQELNDHWYVSGLLYDANLVVKCPCGSPSRLPDATGTATALQPSIQQMRGFWYEFVLRIKWVRRSGIMNQRESWETYRERILRTDEM